MPAENFRKIKFQFKGYFVALLDRPSFSCYNNYITVDWCFSIGLVFVVEWFDCTLLLSFVYTVHSVDISLVSNQILKAFFKFSLNKFSSVFIVIRMNSQ